MQIRLHSPRTLPSLEKIGLALHKKGSIIVDEQFRTSVDSVYAIGDVIDRVALTPVALAEGMVVAAHLFQQGELRLSYENIPTAVFSHPNVAMVGLIQLAVRKDYGTVRIFKSEFKALKHTLSGSKERTFMKLVVDAASDRVLGLHMVGADAGEVVQGFAVTLQCNATKAQFDATIGIHPTLWRKSLSPCERRFRILTHCQWKRFLLVLVGRRDWRSLIFDVIDECYWWDGNRAITKNKV